MRVTLNDLQTSLSCHLQRVRHLLVGLKTVFRGLCFTPKLPLKSILFPLNLESHLVLNSLATASVASNYQWRSRTICSNLGCLKSNSITNLVSNHSQY